MISLVLIVGLLAFTAISLEITKAHAVVRASETRLLSARMIAESGLARALARLKEGGETLPTSGGGPDGDWVDFGEGEYFYETTVDVPNQTAQIRAWARVPIDTHTSGSTAAPDDANWDGTGYVTTGLEVTFSTQRILPESPAYFGNGGIEQPLGGFDWGNGVDPFDPSTWQLVTSNPDSYQSSSVPMEVNALDHPVDHLYNGGAPLPATPGVHDYAPWISQTAVGQANVEAWMNYSAGGGSAMSGFTPSPTGNYSADPSSPDYVFPINPDIPDVQDYAWSLWSAYHDDPIATTLNSGSHSGTYGTQTDPGITFVTGTLNVPAGSTFEGNGILVIRDDYDPNVDSNNTPSIDAEMFINGTFKWTGLVIIAGWRPTVAVRPGGDATIVGTLMGEDSVMSGGEVSLDSATIILKVEDKLRLRYSSGLFQPGSFVYDYLPGLLRTIVGSRDLYAP